MKRFMEKIFLAGLVITVALIVSVCDLRAEDQNLAAFHPVISNLEGNVKVLGLKYSVWEPATVGTLLLAGDTIMTGWNSRAEISFLSGTVHLYENSIMIIPSIGVQDRKKDIQEVFVEEGNARFDINPLGVQRHFEFRTKNVQGGVKGTVFTVSFVDKGTNISVSEGTVWISNPDREVKTVRVLDTGDIIRVETPEDFLKVRGVNPDYDIEDYSYNVPPGQEEKSSLPADYNSNPDNNGVRSRGVKEVKEVN